MLGDFRHGSPLVMYFRGRRLVDVRADGEKPADETDGSTPVVHAGVDLFPDPAHPGAGDVFPLADGTVVDLVDEEKDPAFRWLGYAVVVRHNNKTDGRETYSLYAHLRDPPGGEVGNGGGDAMEMKAATTRPGAGGAAGAAASQPVDNDKPDNEAMAPKVRRLFIGDEVKAGKTTLGYAGASGAAFGPAGPRLHVEVRHFNGHFHPAWRGLYGVPGKTFDPAVFERDWVDPERFAAPAGPATRP